MSVSKKKVYDPAWYVKQLASDKDGTCLESLLAKINSTPFFWVTEFAVKGLDALSDILNDCYSRCSANYDKIQLLCIRCLRSIMNRTEGIDLVFHQKKILTVIARSLDTTKPEIMIEAVQILAALCFIPPDGHDRVIDAITESSEIERREERFKPLIQGLLESKNENLKLQCIILINALLTQSNDLDYRLLLRDEIMRVGFYGFLKELEKNATQLLLVHISVFKEQERNDFLELEMDATVGSVPNPFVENLKKVLANSSKENSRFKSSKENFRANKRFKIDSDVLAEEEIKENLSDLQKKLDKLISLKEETEAKIIQLEKQLQKYNDF